MTAIAMRLDPKGYYAELDVLPEAAAAEISAAYRRKARQVHPDIPGTGNLAAFLRLRTAYEIVGNPISRAAYDRSARQPLRSSRPERGPIARPAAARGPRLSDWPMLLWLLAGGSVCFAAAMGVVRVIQPAPTRHETGPPLAPPALASRLDHLARGEPAPEPASPLNRSVATDHFVVPGAGIAWLWRGNPADRLIPSEVLLPFTPVQVRQVLAESGLVQVMLADGGTGYVDALRLSPGDAATSHRAYCTYNAGLPPSNAEILARQGAGNGTLRVENHGAEPAVVKLRTDQGETVLTVYLAPGGAASLDALPDARYRPDVAFGEVWSRACQSFMAGMRVQRFAAFTPLASLSPLALPPAATIAVDKPDSAFGGD